MKGIPSPLRRALGILLLVLAVLLIQQQRALRSRQERMRPVAQRVIAAPVPRHPEKAPFYTIEVLGTLPGYVDYFPKGINARGQIVGDLSGPRVSHAHQPETSVGGAFLWTEGRMQELGTLASANVSAADINASGQVVGTSDDHPFLWARGVMTDLAPGESNRGGAEAINDAGQVAGSLSRVPGFGSSRAFLWTEGRLRDLGTLAGEDSGATDISAAGQVVGHSSIGPSADTRAFLWTDGNMRNLGTLGGTQSSATAINDVGVVVGYSGTSGDAETHACRWSKGALQDLGTLPGDGDSRANDINASGQVVGSSMLPPTGPPPPADYLGGSAFLYTDATGMVDLNTRIDRKPEWHLSNAMAINDAGQIVAMGQLVLPGRHLGNGRAIRLTPKVRPSQPVRH
jgi:probable HAF family extracellular repeat protein